MLTNQSSSPASHRNVAAANLALCAEDAAGGGAIGARNAADDGHD